MTERCLHGSPEANCADCTIERLTRERDEARTALADAIEVAREYAMLFHDEKWSERHARWQAALEGRCGAR